LIRSDNLNNFFITQTQIILAQNFREKVLIQVFISYVFSIFILMYLDGKIAKTLINIAKNFKENDGDFRLMHHVLII
jgi:hypothetical protein